MHHYRHEIKDFNTETRHLTRVERSLYRDLRDVYLETEQPLTCDLNKLSRKVMAISEEEKEALKYVLDEFFELTGNVYSNDFCDEQIAWYQSNTSNKSRAGKASAAARKKAAKERKDKRKTKAKQDSTGVEQASNTKATKPVTSNQQPVTNINNNAYAFCGDRIKLNEKDYRQCKVLYPSIDVDYYLRQLDAELRDEKKWFKVMHAKLEYKNRTVEGASNATNRHFKNSRPSLQERADQQSDNLQTYIESVRESEHPVDLDDATILPQVGHH